MDFTEEQLDQIQQAVVEMLLDEFSDASVDGIKIHKAQAHIMAVNVARRLIGFKPSLPLPKSS